jgi:CheY-like chemotaxis protein
VIDFMLPGLSGLEVCRRVRQEHRGEPIKLVVFTADDNQNLRASCLEAGADDVIVKSSESSEIISVITRLVHL